MHRTDNATSTTVLPPPTAAGPNPDSYFQPGTIVDAEWLTMLQEEMISVLVAAGITPNKAVYTQLSAAISAIATSLDTILVNTAHDWEDNQYIGEKLLAYAASQAWNVLFGQNVHLTLTGDCTITAISNAQPGAVYVLRVIQDATGNRTITWPANVRWMNDATPPAEGANQHGLISLYYTGALFLASYAGPYNP